MNKTTSTQEKTAPKSVIRPDLTVAELVLRYPHLRVRLEQMGIDYCCGGKRPLAEAIPAAGLDLQNTVAELEATLKSLPPSAATNWSTVSLTVLANHILDTHHVFTKTQLKRIDQLLAKVQKAHRATHGTMLDTLRKHFDALKAELESHLMKEEEILFPAIKGIDGFLAGRNSRPVVHCGSVAHPIRQMEHEHDAAGSALITMRQLTSHYQLPTDACPTFQALYEALVALEEDLHEHIYLENNILFPGSVEQENVLKHPTA